MTDIDILLSLNEQLIRLHQRSKSCRIDHENYMASLAEQIKSIELQLTDYYTRERWCKFFNYIHTSSISYKC